MGGKQASGREPRQPLEAAVGARASGQTHARLLDSVERGRTSVAAVAVWSCWAGDQASQSSPSLFPAPQLLSSPGCLPACLFCFLSRELERGGGLTESREEYSHHMCALEWGGGEGGGGSMASAQLPPPPPAICWLGAGRPPLPPSPPHCAAKLVLWVHDPV